MVIMNFFIKLLRIKRSKRFKWANAFDANNLKEKPLVKNSYQIGKHCSVGIEMARITITIAIMTKMIQVNNKNTNNHTDKIDNDNL